MDFFSIMICWFLPVLLGFRAYLPIFLFFPFLRKRFMLQHDFLVSSGSGLGLRGLSPFFFFRFFFQEWGDQWMLYCTWALWKHGLLLFGVYAGVILFFVRSKASKITFWSNWRRPWLSHFFVLPQPSRPWRWLLPCVLVSPGDVFWGIFLDEVLPCWSKMKRRGRTVKLLGIAPELSFVCLHFSFFAFM